MLVMAKVTLQICAVMRRHMGVLRLHSRGLPGQLRRWSMTGHALGHTNSFVFFHIAVALGTADIFKRMDVTCRQAATEGTGVVCT